MKKVFQDNEVNNAGMIIEHRKNPKVTFHYPNKKTAFGVCFSSFLALWIHIILFFLFGNIIFILPYMVINSINRGEGLGIQINTNVLMTIVSIFYLVFFIPFITALIFSINPKLLKYMPEINKFVNKGINHYIKIDKISKRVFEIPVFGNIFLDYKATEEFSKYLKKVEIKEHNFFYIEESFFRKNQKTKNDSYWYAKFYFERIPKTGQLEVLYD